MAVLTAALLDPQKWSGGGVEEIAAQQLWHGRKEGRIFLGGFRVC